MTLDVFLRTAARHRRRDARSLAAVGATASDIADGDRIAAYALAVRALSDGAPWPGCRGRSEYTWWCGFYAWLDSEPSPPPGRRLRLVA